MIYMMLSVVVVGILFYFMGWRKVISVSQDRYGSERTNEELKWGINKKQLISLLGLLLLIPSFIGSVPANSVGILYSPFTGVSETTLNEGFNPKNPFSKVYKISTEVQTIKLDKIYTQTSDSQYITSSLDIKYQVNSTNAFVVFKQFRTLDNMSTTLIAPTVQRMLELITTQYNVIDILGASRSEMYKGLEVSLAEELSKYGVTFHSVTITDTDAGEAIEKAIEQEAVAKKAVETAEQEYLRVQTEAKQKVVAAQAEQDSAKIQAETKLIQAKAEQESNGMLDQSLSKEILYKMYIDKWNGKLSQIVSGDNGFMINLGELE